VRPDGGPQALMGKPVKIRYGPAAVIGDETRTTSLSRHNGMGRRGR
jgi:hypothetical protein